MFCIRVNLEVFHLFLQIADLSFLVDLQRSQFDKFVLLAINELFEFRVVLLELVNLQRCSVVARLKVSVQGVETVELGFELKSKRYFLLIVGDDELHVLTQLVVSLLQLS